MIGSYAVTAMQTGGRFGSLFGVQAAVNHVLSTVVHHGTVIELVVTQSLQWPN